MKTETTTKLVIDTNKDLHTVIVLHNNAVTQAKNFRDTIAEEDREKMLEEVKRLMQESFKMGLEANNA